MLFASSLSEVECRGLKNSVKLGLFEESSSETSSEVEFLTLFYVLNNPKFLNVIVFNQCIKSKVLKRLNLETVS